MLPTPRFCQWPFSKFIEQFGPSELQLQPADADVVGCVPVNVRICGGIPIGVVAFGPVPPLPSFLSLLLISSAFSSCCSSWE
jgi:hypothetical protein